MTENEGVKDDAIKVPLELLPVDALEEVGRVLEFGANKYKRGNWAKGIAFSRILGAILRHVFAILRGENRDPETGRLHAAHLTAEAMFLCAYQLRGMSGELDDRATLGQPEYKPEIDRMVPPAAREALDEYAGAMRDAVQEYADAVSEAFPLPTIEGLAKLWSAIKLTDESTHTTATRFALDGAPIADDDAPERGPKGVPVGALWTWITIDPTEDRRWMYWNPDWAYAGHVGGVQVEGVDYCVDGGDGVNAVVIERLARLCRSDAERIHADIRAFAKSCGADWPDLAG